jgi:hypothetical protein
MILAEGHSLGGSLASPTVQTIDNPSRERGGPEAGLRKQKPPGEVRLP